MRFIAAGGLRFSCGRSGRRSPPRSGLGSGRVRIRPDGGEFRPLLAPSDEKLALEADHRRVHEDFAPERREMRAPRR